MFQGELSTAQHRGLTTTLRQQLDLTYDSIRIYRIGSPHLVHIETLGAELDHPDPVL